MATTKRTFHKGRMNLDDDERLLEQGEYREAYNISVINSEGSDVGAVEKNLSNKKLTFFDVGSNPKDLGKFEDQKNAKLYWFTLSDTGAYLFEWDDNNKTQSVVLADTRPPETRVLDLKEDYLITGIGKILSQDGKNDLLLATDFNIEPLCINIERAKGYGVNGFEKEDIYLIKKPPSFSPKTTLILDSSDGNYIEDKFFCFATRYRYLDGEFSALSNLSVYNFKPKGFDIDYFECQNKVMVNAFNAINIEFDTGDKRVTDIQVIAKQSNSNVPVIVETFNKQDLGWQDNEKQNFNFYNNKVYTALPEKELYRHYDNVPRKAKALTIPSNLPLFGNYLEGYNLIKADGNKMILDYNISFNSYDSDDGFEFVSSFNNTSTFSTFQLDIPSDNPFLSGLSLGISISFAIDVSDAYNNGFFFILDNDYSSFDELYNDDQFQSFLTAINQDIELNYNYDLAPNKVISQHPYIDVSYSSNNINFILYPVIIDDDSPPSNLETIETQYREADTVLSLNKTDFGLSCKTNRSYEIGVIYKDGFKRASKVLTIPINSIYIPQLYSDQYNKLQVAINSTAPYWAKYYTLAIKSQPLQYQTVIITQFYQEDNYTWCLLQADNKDKVKVGDLLIPKTVPNIAVGVDYIKVLEIKTQEKGFIEGNTDEQENEIEEPSGVYMKIRPSGFSMDAKDLKVYQDTKDNKAQTYYPAILLDLFSKTVNNVVEDLAIPAGSYIYIKLYNSRKFDDWHRLNYEKQYFAQQDYDSIEDWFNDYVIGNDIFFKKTVDKVVGQEDGVENLGDNLELVRDGDGLLQLKFVAHYKGRQNKQYSYVNGEIFIRTGQGAYIFETSPKQAEQEIFYESSQEFEIVNGEHLGNLQNQNGSDPAIVELDFFNCFSFGNGVESYRVRDSVIVNTLNVDTRPTAVSIEPYKEVHRFADWTYGEPYVESAGINGINVFNLSTANYKEGDKQYGSIQILFTRNTDILSIQERKAFKVLFGKDMISTADGNTVVSAIPQILGQIVPYMGDNGIGLHPESFAYDAYRAWYFCPDNSTPIRISNDGTTEINYKMKDFFRDLTIDSYGSKKIGGYDPHKDLYVLTSEAPLSPEHNVGCGNILFKESTEPFTYTFNLNSLLGDIVLNYNVSQGEVDIHVDYDNAITQENNATNTGTITVPRNSTNQYFAQVTITPISESAQIEITNICPIGVPLKITQIVLCDDLDIGKTIVNRIAWANGSPYSRNVLFETSGLNSFIEETGVEGIGKFPSNGSQVSIQAFKGQLNTGSFVIGEGNRMGYIISDQNYVEADLQTIINNTTWLTVSETQLTSNILLNNGDFTFTRPDVNHNLYLIWDYSKSNQPPIAANDNIIVGKGEFVDVGILNNDSDPENDTLQISIVSQPNYGTIIINQDNTIKYTHNDSVNFSDSFKYKVYDGIQYSNTATVSITILDDSAPLWDGLISVDDCSDNSGINTLVDVTGTGGILGDTYVLDGTATPFSGGNNWYRPVLGASQGNQTNIASLNIANFIVNIDDTGTVVSVNSSTCDPVVFGNYDGLIAVDSNCMFFGGNNTLITVGETAVTSGFVGQIFYLQSNSSQRFNGGDSWYRLNFGLNTAYYSTMPAVPITTYMLKINSQGVVTDINHNKCS
mgnify:CR=1 FL=1